MFEVIGNVVAIPDSAREIFVQGDNSTNVLSFKVPRFSGAQDLSELTAMIKTKNKYNLYDFLYPVVTVEEEFIVLEWNVAATSTLVNGELEVQIQFQGIITATQIAPVWQSSVFTLIVSGSLISDEEIYKTSPTAFMQWANDFKGIKQDVVDTLGAADEIIEDIENTQAIIGEKQVEITNEFGRIENVFTEMEQALTQAEALIEGVENIQVDVAENAANISSLQEQVADNGVVNKFTSAEKAKLSAIDSGAQVNVIESVSVNSQPVAISDKGINIILPEPPTVEIINSLNSTSTEAALSAAQGKAIFDMMQVQSGVWTPKMMPGMGHIEEYSGATWQKINKMVFLSLTIKFVPYFNMPIPFEIYGAPFDCDGFSIINVNKASLLEGNAMTIGGFMEGDIFRFTAINSAIGTHQLDLEHMHLNVSNELSFSAMYVTDE